MRMQISKLRTFQLPWILLQVHQPVSFLFRQHCLQNLRFHNKNPISVYRIHKKVPRIPESEKLLYISLIGQGNRIDVFPPGTKRIADIDQCAKSHVGPCCHNQKPKRRGILHWRRLHKAAHEKCHQVKSHQCLRQHSSRLKPQSQNQHDPGTASMKKHLCRKQPIRWYIKNEAGKKGADGCRQQDPSAASFSQKQFANNAKKNIIHKKIRQKDDVYVYVIIHKKAPCGRQSFTLVSEPIIRSQGAQILSKRDGKS